MSGTSLDGLDMVLCHLEKRNDQWKYSIIKSVSIEYSVEWKKNLEQAVKLSGKELLLLHRRYGSWLGECVMNFLADVNPQPDLIASHGHTVFHEPQNNFNFQLGDANMIAAKTGIVTVSDFRSLDICLNGQGAPLVPIGDQLLFSEYDACVNIGGFVNVSCDIDGERRAWDICPANFVLNRLVDKIGLSMDKDGALGKEGQVIQPLLDELNTLAYYQLDAPKSLAQEWVECSFQPIIDRYAGQHLADIVRTCYQHMALIISKELNSYAKGGKILFTGGGVLNVFLMDLIKQYCSGQIVIPDRQIIDYKEALVFALLGALRLNGESNCLKTVTGADRSCSSGIVI